MEFIQCPHCQKKYTLSDQLRAAVGKKIRCKHCAEAFEIQIQQISKNSPPCPASDFVASTDLEEKPTGKTNSIDASEVKNEPEPQAQAQTQTAQQDQAKNKKIQTTKKKTLNIQLIIMMVLLLVLMAAAIAAYLFFNNTIAFDSSAKKDVQHIIPQGLVKPIDIKLSRPATEQAIQRVEQKTVKLAENKATPLPSKAAPKTISEPVLQANEPNNQPSQVCKDISADYWLRSHTLATTSMDTATYMKLLDQNLQQADEIRRRCKQKGVIGSIIKAIRSDQKPAWIAQEINARIESDRRASGAVQSKRIKSNASE